MYGFEVILKLKTMNDRQMREPLFDYLEAFYGKIRILEEKNAGRSRADVIGVVDGALIGFEIRSDRDSYTRLKTQKAVLAKGDVLGFDKDTERGINFAAEVF